MFSRATIRLGIGPHSSFDFFSSNVIVNVFLCKICGCLEDECESQRTL